MSARKLHDPDIFETLSIEPQTTRLDLPSTAVCIRKNGIEFQSDTPIPNWTEMTVALETPGERKKVHCTGVIVACIGSRQTGYSVSMVFTNLSESAEARINSLT